MQPTTPTGSRTMSELPTCSSQAVCSTTSAIDMKSIVGRPAWIWTDSSIGMPTSRETSAAISSPRAASCIPIAWHSSARSCGGT
jgi:hypothetical protein